MYQYCDEELGLIVLTPNARAKRIIVKRRVDHLAVTYPAGCGLQRVKEQVAQLKERIIKLEPVGCKPITIETTFSTFTFTVKIERSSFPDKYRVSLKEGILTVMVPTNGDLSRQEEQSIMRQLIEVGLRHEAKRVLPTMVATMAKQYGFHHQSVKINKSRTRWGSCSSSKNINLSYFLLLLPEEMIRTILLHELCHTVEMNHGPAFWALMDRFTENRGRELDHAIKGYRNEALLYLTEGTLEYQ